MAIGNSFVVKNSGKNIGMSQIEQLDRYINPPIPPKTDTIFKSYSHFSSIGNAPNDDEVIYV